MNIPILSVPQGAIVGILGDNGAGKTTFAKCLCGLEKKAKGTLNTSHESLGTKQRLKRSYMVMQDVNHQLLQKVYLMKFFSVCQERMHRRTKRSLMKYWTA